MANVVLLVGGFLNKKARAIGKLIDTESQNKK
ncbi:MAG: hypothetical protein CEN90_281 [Parcubacteria group bacterium Licking1014_17]|nr:MAG: hypothetical protein CEN90_281 [Parcubacteria group bacterium Licking1014_17]